jgi:hypothetical protein
VRISASGYASPVVLVEPRPTAVRERVLDDEPRRDVDRVVVAEELRAAEARRADRLVADLQDRVRAAVDAPLEVGPRVAVADVEVDAVVLA